MDSQEKKAVVKDAANAPKGAITRNTGEAEIKPRGDEHMQIPDPNSVFEKLANAITKKSHDLQTTTILKRHRNVNKGNDENAVTFFSYAKEMVLFVNERHLLKFASHMYITDKQDEIDWLLNNEAFGTAYWKDKFPPEVVDRFKDNKEKLMRPSDYLETIDDIM